MFGFIAKRGNLIVLDCFSLPYGNTGMWHFFKLKLRNSILMFQFEIALAQTSEIRKDWMTWHVTKPLDQISINNSLFNKSKLTWRDGRIIWSIWNFSHVKFLTVSKQQITTWAHVTCSSCAREIHDTGGTVSLKRHLKAFVKHACY